MKKFIILLFFPIITFAQTKDPFVSKNDAVVYALQLIAGAANGEHDYLLYHTDKFLQRHPNANPQWYDPRISWHNKYSRSWLVQNVFVFVTDENHFTPAIEHTAFLLSFAISYSDVKKNWKQIAKSAVKRGILGYVANRAGFHITYR